MHIMYRTKFNVVEEVVEFAEAGRVVSVLAMFVPNNILIINYANIPG